MTLELQGVRTLIELSRNFTQKPLDADPVHILTMVMSHERHSISHQLFVQQLVQTDKKKIPWHGNIVCITGPLSEETTSEQWIPHTKGQWCGKCFHAMTSWSCYHILWSLGLQSQLTHWGRVTHICISKLTIIGSDNGLLPGRRQAIIWTSAGILLIWLSGTNFNEILIKIQQFSLKKGIWKCCLQSFGHPVLTFMC